MIVDVADEDVLRGNPGFFRDPAAPGSVIAETMMSASRNATRAEPLSNTSARR